MRHFGLIGRPLVHSASARYFTEKFRREGLVECSYALHELSCIGELPALLAATPDLCGLNVTIPYKRDVMPYLDRVAPEAAAICAVNCIRRREDGTLEGCNTDIVGLRVSLDRLLGEAQPSGALILGTGGASQAVQYALAERDIPFELVSRDPAKGNYTYDNLPFETVAESRLIVNASPVGTYPAVDAAPRIPYAALTPDHFLLDLVYNPPLTRFLDYGRQRGARILNGETMFREQAEASWRFWNGSM
ncbi:shikimate dehydrogenase [uncultured Alistipes sp.]|uniref:shikimate dehydrogenase family protein n=1 Tax=uncultured Alistipes sp. TaxID=538949 RepID=UPI0026055707|nr:shikimate dehydrogenase [uncultured Alistipes sp.]